MLCINLHFTSFSPLILPLPNKTCLYNVSSLVAVCVLVLILCWTTFCICTMSLQLHVKDSLFSDMPMTCSLSTILEVVMITQP